MLSIYEDYLKHKEERTDGQKLWNQVPKSIIDTTICATIGENTIDGIFKKVDQLKGNNKVDIIIGGPPCAKRILSLEELVWVRKLRKILEMNCTNITCNLLNAMIPKCSYSRMYWDY